MPACLQVYGDAIIDEAPLLFVSNYHVTVFLKRSEHVQNKQLWASEPIWWNRQHPSARSCWLRFLQVAKEMQDIKLKLPRMVVPRTASGYILPQVSNQVHSPAAKRLRPKAQSAIKLMASSNNRKGYELVSKGTVLPSVSASTQQQPPSAMAGECGSLCRVRSICIACARVLVCSIHSSVLSHFWLQVFGIFTYYVMSYRKQAVLPTNTCF